MLRRQRGVNEIDPGRDVRYLAAMKSAVGLLCLSLSLATCQDPGGPAPAPATFRPQMPLQLRRPQIARRLGSVPAIVPATAPVADGGAAPR